MWSIVATLAAPVCAAVAAPPAPNGSTAPQPDPVPAGDITAAADPASFVFIAVVGIAAMVSLVILWKTGLFRKLGGTPGNRPRDPDAVHPLAWFWALFVMLFLMAIGSQAGSILASPEAATPRAQAIGLGVSGAVGVAASIGVLLLAKRFAPKAGLLAAKRDLLTGLIAFALAYPIVLAVSTVATLVAGLLGAPPTGPIAHDTLQLIADAMHDPWTWAVIAAVVVVIPVVEEVMYRGLLQTALLRLIRKPWLAAIGTAALFAGMHWTIIPEGGKHAVVQLFALGVAMGIAFERTGRLGTPIVMHVLFNLTNILLALAVTTPA